MSKLFCKLLSKISNPTNIIATVHEKFFSSPLLKQITSAHDINLQYKIYAVHIFNGRIVNSQNFSKIEENFLLLSFSCLRVYIKKFFNYIIIMALLLMALLLIIFILQCQKWHRKTLESFFSHHFPFNRILFDSDTLSVSFVMLIILMPRLSFYIIKDIYRPII